MLADERAPPLPTVVAVVVAVVPTLGVAAVVVVVVESPIELFNEINKLMGFVELDLDEITFKLTFLLFLLLDDLILQLQLMLKCRHRNMSRCSTRSRCSRRSRRY